MTVPEVEQAPPSAEELVAEGRREVNIADLQEAPPAQPELEPEAPAEGGLAVAGRASAPSATEYKTARPEPRTPISDTDT